MMRMRVPVATQSTSSKRLNAKYYHNSNFDVSLFVTFFSAFANAVIALPRFKIWSISN